MSVTSLSYIRISTRNSPCSSSSTACCSSSNSSFRISATKSAIGIASIRSSQAEGPLRRPVAAPPQVVKPVPPAQPQPPPSAVSPPPPPPPVVKPAGMGSETVITMEFQRQKAKEMQEYFKQKKIEEANQGPFFGFIGKNEISNGRWAMFGFAVGMLTEYATGSDFVDQVKILLSNFGIIDLD